MYHTSNKTIRFKLIVFALFTVISFSTLAIPCDQCGSDPDCQAICNPTEDGVPLNSNAIILVLAGMALLVFSQQFKNKMIKKQASIS